MATAYITPQTITELWPFFACSWNTRYFKPLTSRILYIFNIQIFHNKFETFRFNKPKYCHIISNKIFKCKQTTQKTSICINIPISVWTNVTWIELKLAGTAAKPKLINKNVDRNTKNAIFLITINKSWSWFLENKHNLYINTTTKPTVYNISIHLQL